MNRSGSLSYAIETLKVIAESRKGAVIEFNAIMSHIRTLKELRDGIACTYTQEEFERLHGEAADRDGLTEHRQTKETRE
jgi:hypothetical protein